MSDDKEAKKSAATVLVEFAQSRYTFGISTDGEPFAVPLMGDPVARLLRGGKRGLRSRAGAGLLRAVRRRRRRSRRWRTRCW